MAHIIFSHGDKGGVGKSVIAATLVDYLLAQQRPVQLIEGDKSQPDVGPRFVGRVAVEGVNLNRTDEPEDAVIQFVDAVNEIASPDDVVVVNLPASASDTLDRIASVLIAAACESGHTSSMAYSIGHTKTATEGIRSSVENGLAGAIGPQGVTIVHHEFLGEWRQFDYLTSGTRGAIGQDFHEISIPAINPQPLAQKVFATQRPLSDLVEKWCPDLKVTERMLFDQHFLKPAHEAVATMVAEPAPQAPAKPLEEVRQ